MRDRDCVELLQWALPRLGMRWRGFRKPRRQVCKRIQARIDALGLADAAAYRARLEADPDGAEWAALDHLCRVTISRFYRDHSVWWCLADEVLPALGAPVRAWSAGCASGEEPHTLALVWHLVLGAPGRLAILATDTDRAVLERARRACYPDAALRELPEGWKERAFERRDEGTEGDEWCLGARFREGIRYARHDVRAAPPAGPFDLIFCRNLAFTYFDEPGQRRVLDHLRGALRPGGALVTARNERLPEGHGLEAWSVREGVWRQPRPDDARGGG